MSLWLSPGYYDPLKSTLEPGLNNPSPTHCRCPVQAQEAEVFQ